MQKIQTTDSLNRLFLTMMDNMMDSWSGVMINSDNDSMAGVGFHYLYSIHLEPGGYTMIQRCIAGTIIDIDGE